MIDTDAYEDMTLETPSDELADAVENLLVEVERSSDTISKLKAEVEGTLKVEKKTYDDGGESDPIIQGWIEGLEYVLRQIEVLS